MRSMVSDGTNLYLATQGSLQKIVVATGASSTINNDKFFVSLTYGNSILYAADQDGIYSVNVTTGALTPIVDMEGITGIMYFSATHLLVLKGNSLAYVAVADGSYTYKRQDL